MDDANLIRDPDHLKSFLTDASGFHGSADGVAHPTSIDDVRRVLRAAADESLTVTVAGSRTGLAGGCVPTDGIVLSTDRIRPPFEFDEEQSLLRVGAGYRLAEVQEYAVERGLLYPPDPTDSLASIPAGYR